MLLKKIFPMVCLLPAVGMAEQKPNIVFILADDLGYGDLSCLNEDCKINTPNIDKLAENGLIFSDAHSNSSVSTPTRYGVLTGRYAFRTLKKGVLNGYSAPLIKNRATIASMLLKEGYNTACIGKWHLGWDWTLKENSKSNKDIDFTKPIKNGPLSVGFSYFYGIAASLDMPPYVYVENDSILGDEYIQIKGGKSPAFYRPGTSELSFVHGDCLNKLTDRAVSFIKDQREDVPFFLYFPVTAPHTPIMPSKEFTGKTESRYLDFVLTLDNVVGKIVKTLKEKDMLSNTILVFTSDNGCSPAANFDELGKIGHKPNYIYRGAKADLYDGGHRIPLIISWGQKYHGEKNGSLVCLTDFFRTFADLTGYKVAENEGEDSYSILPILDGTGDTERKYVVHHSVDGSFSIRDKRWKLLVGPDSGGWSYPNPKKDKNTIKTLPPMQLFDMQDDVEEVNNIWDKNSKIVNVLSDELKEIISNGRSTTGKKQRNDYEVVLK